MARSLLTLPWMLHVLFAEDDPLIRRMVVRRLGGAVRVTEAEDGQHALELAQAGSYDVLLTDVGMPRLDGIDLLRALNRLEHPLGVRAVVLTSDPMMARQMLEGSGLVVLEKTPPAERLVDELERAARRAAGERA